MTAPNEQRMSTRQGKCGKNSIYRGAPLASSSSSLLSFVNIEHISFHWIPIYLFKPCRDEDEEEEELSIAIPYSRREAFVIGSNKDSRGVKSLSGTAVEVLRL